MTRILTRFQCELLDREIAEWESGRLGIVTPDQVRILLDSYRAAMELLCNPPPPSEAVLLEWSAKADEMVRAYDRKAT